MGTEVEQRVGHISISLEVQHVLDQVEMTAAQLPPESIGEFLDQVLSLLSSSSTKLVDCENSATVATGGGFIFRLEVVGLGEVCAAALAARKLDSCQRNH